MASLGQTLFELQLQRAQQAQQQRIAQEQMDQQNALKMQDMLFGQAQQERAQTLAEKQAALGHERDMEKVNVMAKNKLFMEDDKQAARKEIEDAKIQAAHERQRAGIYAKNIWERDKNRLRKEYNDLLELHWQAQDALANARNEIERDKAEAEKNRIEAEIKNKEDDIILRGAGVAVGMGRNLSTGVMPDFTAVEDKNDIAAALMMMQYDPKLRKPETFMQILGGTMPQRGQGGYGQPGRGTVLAPPTSSTPTRTPAPAPQPQAQPTGGLSPRALQAQQLINGG